MNDMNRDHASLPLASHRMRPLLSPFTAARILVAAPVLPLVADTLPLAEQFRSALLSKCKDLCLRRNAKLSDQEVWSRAPAFVGKDADGRPLTGHGHAFFLPADEDGDGRIDHVTLVAERGLSGLERRAVERLRVLRFGAGEPLRVALVALGRTEQLRGAVLDESATWVSATPFVATRYPKLRGRKRDQPADYATPLAFARHVLQEELERLRQRRPDLPAVIAIEPLPVQYLGAGRLRPLQFKRERRKAGDDGSRRPSGAFCIAFAAPTRGPLCLGHSSHLGLGLFVPGEEEKERKQAVMS